MCACAHPTPPANADVVNATLPYTFVSLDAAHVPTAFVGLRLDWQTGTLNLHLRHASAPTPANRSHIDAFGYRVQLFRSGWGALSQDFMELADQSPQRQASASAPTRWHTFWVNELDVHQARETEYIGPFRCATPFVHRVLAYIFRAMRWPPATCVCIYHGTDASSARSIWNENRVRTHGETYGPRSPTPPMCGRNWVYGSRDYLKARRFAYMNSALPGRARVHSQGAIVRCVVRIPSKAHQVQYVGRFPYACGCARCGTRPEDERWRVDHDDVTDAMLLQPTGVTQVWVDGNRPGDHKRARRTVPEYLVRPDEVRILAVITIPNPPASDDRDVRAYCPYRVVRQTSRPSLPLEASWTH